MIKSFKFLVYILISIFIIIFLIFTFLAIKASYGGVKLNFLEGLIKEEIKSSSLINLDIESIVLNRDNQKGFYFEIKKLKAEATNNTLLQTDALLFDFRIFNLFTLSIDKNNTIYAKNLKILNSDSQIYFDEMLINFDELDNINLSIKKIDFKYSQSNLDIICVNSKFYFNTKSLYSILVSEIEFKSSLFVNDERYEAEINYNPNTKKINITKFRGDYFYLNDNSEVQFDSDYKTAQIKLDLKLKNNVVFDVLELNDENRFYPLINNFIGWQSIFFQSTFSYNSPQFFSDLIQNSILNISGIYELESLLPKDSYYSNFGNTTYYELEFYNKKEKYVLNFNKVKNDKIVLKKGSFLKLNKKLNDANLNLVTSINKKAVINFLRTSILSRESSTGRAIKFLETNLNQKNDVTLNFNINPLSNDIYKSLKNLYVISSGELNSNFIFDENQNPNYISGPINYYIEIKDLEKSTPVLKGQIDLTRTKAYIRQINFQKEKDSIFKIKFEGVTNSTNDSIVTFDSLDSEIDFEGKIKITKTNHIYLEKLFINNNSNINLKLSGDLSKRILNLKVKGEIIDLSKNKVEVSQKKRNYYLKKENYSILTDKVIFSGLVKVNKFRATIEKEGSKISINSRADYKGHELKYSREKNEHLDVNIINSSDITHFVNNDHPVRKLLSDGKFKMTSIRKLNSNVAEVKIKLNDFVMINTPASLKLLSLPSISGLVSIAEGEQGIRFGYGEINYKETESKFSEIEAFAVSDSLGLIMEGNINRKMDSIDIKGEISPMHLVNAIIQKLPIIGPIIVGDEGEGLFSIDFTMKGSTDDPDVESNPLTIIKPRIIERAIEAIDNEITIQ